MKFEEMNNSGIPFGHGTLSPMQTSSPTSEIAGLNGGTSFYVPFVFYKTYERMGRDIFVSWDSDTINSFYYVAIAVFDFDPKTGDDPDQITNVFANYDNGLYVSREIQYNFTAGNHLKHSFTAPQNNHNYWYVTYTMETNGGTRWVTGHNNSADYIEYYSSPNITYTALQNKLTFSNYTSGNTCAIEIYRPNHTPLSSYSLDHKNVFYEACMRLSEFGVYENSQTYYDRNKLHRFSSGTKKIRVMDWNETSIEYISAFEDMIDDWRTNINSLLTNGTQFVYDETAISPDIRMYFGTPLELWGDAGANYGGTWDSYYDVNGYISYSEVRINTQTFINEGWNWTTFEAIITEELTEACGCGNDISSRADNIFTEYNYPNKNPTGAFNSIDQSVIKLLYNEGLPVNSGTDVIAELVNPENGLMSADTTYVTPNLNLNTFDEQTTYYIRYWQVRDSNKSSARTNWQSITTPDYPNTPNSPSLVKRVNSGFNIDWNSITNADYYTIRHSTDEITYTSTTSSTNSKAITGLEYGRTYYVNVRADSNFLPDSNYSSNSVVTTCPKLPSIAGETPTINSVVINISGMTGYWDKVVVQYRQYGDTNWTSVNVNSPTLTTTLTSLSAGTRYEVRAYSSKTVNATELVSVDTNGDSAYTSIVNVYTKLPTPNSPLLNGDRVDAGLPLYWNTITNASGYTVRYSTDQITYSSKTVTGTSTTVTGLLYGRTYYVNVRANSSTHPNSEYSSDNQVTTAPQIPTLSGSSINGTTVTITIGSMSGNYSFFKIWYRNVTDNGDWYYSQVNTTGSHDISGLADGKTYEFKISSFYTTNGTDVESRDTNGNIGFSAAVTYAINSRPSNWSWSYNIASGQEVYGVVGKNIYIMKATEWNEFTARINAFRNYKSLADYTFTTVYGDTDFTKDIINESLNALRDLDDYFTNDKTIPSNRSAGDNILQASVYTDMRDAMNSIA